MEKSPLTAFDESLVRRLSALNRNFYDNVAPSFSRTRKNAWQGWDACFSSCEPFLPSDKQPIALLDVAGGNLRFERYLEEKLPGRAFLSTVLDACAPLVESGFALGEEGFAGNGVALDEGLAGRMSVDFVQADIVELLLSGNLQEVLPDNQDIAVCFGFMHHVPTSYLRISLLRAMVSSLRAGGVCAVSFWCFMCDERLAKKARATTPRALRSLELKPGELGKNDYLLGWQEREDCFRYCHSFTDAEIDEMVCAASDLAIPVARFQADGSPNPLNAYLVLRRK